MFTHLSVRWLFQMSRLFKQSRMGADKPLARPERKQPTATKLGIYSTYSPGSSMHFLAHRSNFWKPLKILRIMSVQPGLCGSNDFRVDEKWRPFKRFLSPENRWWSDGAKSGEKCGDQDIVSPGRPGSSGLQVTGEPGLFRARTRPPW